MCSLLASVDSEKMTSVTCAGLRSKLQQILRRVAPASCRLSRGRPALGGAGGTPAGQPTGRRYKNLADAWGRTLDVSPEIPHPQNTSASFRPVRTTARWGVWCDGNVWWRVCSWKNRSSPHGRKSGTPADGPRYRPSPGIPCSLGRWVSPAVFLPGGNRSGLDEPFGINLRKVLG